MSKIGNILKEARVQRKLSGVDASKSLGIDASLLTRIENGSRRATKDQIRDMSKLYKINVKTLQIEWLSEKLQSLLEGEEYAFEALQVAESEIEYRRSNFGNEEIIARINKLKKQLDGLRPISKAQLSNLRNYFKVKYTYDSNRIEGNTLTLQETALVVDKGITIGGRSVQEHLEAINHSEAVEFILDLVQNRVGLTEYVLKQLHGLVLRGIDKDNAGKYRSVNVMISGSTHKPPQPFMLQKLMEDYFYFYEHNKASMHPVILAAEMHERLVTIHPFIDGNGRTSRLVMNLVLLQFGYPITNISSERANRLKYYSSLEAAQVENNKVVFYNFVSNSVHQSLSEYLELVK
ncbi:MAG: Fic family protein [Sphingobacteriaceae bacterium]|nr:Fic family protein [Sphingobacteriaceae bacterium]MBK7817951.1 Fic family protein [Sphingobacteriaceae bacterium]